MSTPFILSSSIPINTEYYKISGWDHPSISSFQVYQATLNGTMIKTLEIAKTSKNKSFIAIRPITVLSKPISSKSYDFLFSFINSVG